MQPGQHGRRSSTEHPDGEEDDEQCGGEHRLPRVRRCVADRQSKRHRSTKTCNTHTTSIIIGRRAVLQAELGYLVTHLPY